MVLQALLSLAGVIALAVCMLVLARTLKAWHAVLDGAAQFEDLAHLTGHTYDGTLRWYFGAPDASGLWAPHPDDILSHQTKAAALRSDPLLGALLVAMVGVALIASTAFCLLVASGIIAIWWSNASADRAIPLSHGTG